MKAVILAGGKGTRLGELTWETPKPMMRIGNRPLLEHQVNLLKKYGIKDIVIITRHLSEVIEGYFKNGKAFGVSITYFREEGPLGTTGGIKEIEDKLTEDFIVFYGDVMVNINLKRLINFHKRKNSTCTLVLHPNDHPYDSDLVEIDSEQRVIAFHPKPHSESRYYRNRVNAGVYVMSRKILKYIEKGVKADFGKDIFPKIAGKERLYGYNTAEYLKDIGTPERLEMVNRDYLNGRVERFNYENRRKAIFLDRDGVINEKVRLLHRTEDFRLMPGTAQAIKKINNSEFLAIVVTNQPVVARNLCSIEELEEIHKKMETLLGKEHAKLDAVYYCPHHPDKGYPGENPKYKIECECRKPKTGMIKWAEKGFNIDLKGSFIIGDSERDILCGKNAGITTVGVRTGEGCRETEIEPDYFFENLGEAVNFIIHEPYKDYFTKIIKLLSESRDKMPFVISIGGNTRSGKTIFTNYIAEKLRDLNKKIIVIKLDNWLLPKEMRKKEHNVYDRFQINKVNKDITDLLDNKKIKLNKYDTLSRETTDIEVVYKLNKAGIVIIEGVVALSSDALRRLSNLKIFCEIDKDLVTERIFNFYRWKGLSEREIQGVIKARMKDEYSLIEKDKKYADLTVHSG